MHARRPAHFGRRPRFAAAGCQRMDVDADNSIDPVRNDSAGDPVAGHRPRRDFQETIPGTIRRTLFRWLRVGNAETNDDVRRPSPDRRTAGERILTLLRRGITYREIADRLRTTEKTIWRLIRRLDPEAQRPCPPS
jgi:DNA-binding NarL/FixJ family response regulator